MKLPFSVDTNCFRCIFRGYAYDFWYIVRATNFKKSTIMYAVLKTGGKQYKVAQNDVIIVEKLAAERKKKKC